MKIQKAIVTNDDPRSIVSDVLGKASKDAVSKMSRPATLAQRIRRIRRSKRHKQIDFNLQKQLLQNQIQMINMRKI